MVFSYPSVCFYFLLGRRHLICCEPLVCKPPRMQPSLAAQAKAAFVPHMLRYNALGSSPHYADFL